MKLTNLLGAAAIVAGLSSCYAPPAEIGATPMRTSGAYSSSYLGHGSTYHSRAHLDDDDDDYEADEDADYGYPRAADYDDEDDEGDSRYVRYPAYAPGPRAMSYVALPHGARRVSYAGRVYYTHGDTWYQPSGSSYMIVESPYY